jgi:Tfp pilus assembly protein PilN
MTRLHAEISRSINFYRAQQSGTQPARIYLCGGTANLPYVREFFAEKFQLPIEFFNPLQNVAITENVNTEEVVKSAHLLGELVGLSLRGISNCPLELNLRPTSVVNAHKIAARRPFLIAAGACLLLALAGWGAFLWRSASIQGAVLADINTKVSSMKGYEERFNSVKKEIARLSANAAPLSETVDARQAWPRLLTELNARLPDKYIWITQLEPTVDGKPVMLDDPSHSLVPAGAGVSTPVKGKKTVAYVPAIDGLRVTGLYLYNKEKQDQVVSDFVSNLAKSPLFKLDKNERSTILNRTPQNEINWAFPYELQLPLAHPLPIH